MAVATWASLSPPRDTYQRPMGPVTAVDSAPKVAPVLHDEGVVQPQLLTQLAPVFKAGVLPHHVVDRVADEIEKRKGDQPHRQHDGD